LSASDVDEVWRATLAVNVWGVPRTTFDLDFEVDLSESEVSQLLAEADRAGFLVDEAYVRGFTERVGGMHPMVVIKKWVGGRAVHVDLFLPQTPFLRGVFDRAVSVTLDGVARRVVSAADLILLELLAWRHKDRLDVQHVLNVQGIPDEARLRRDAAALGVLPRLEEAVREWGNQATSP